MPREFKDDFNKFLQDYAFWIAFVVAVLIIISVVYIMCFRKKNKIKSIPNLNWENALGGKGNIITAEAKGSRLSIKLVDSNLINKDELSKLGVTSSIAMSDKITLVLSNNASKIAEILNEKSA